MVVLLLSDVTKTIANLLPTTHTKMKVVILIFILYLLALYYQPKQEAPPRIAATIKDLVERHFTDFLLIEDLISTTYNRNVNITTIINMTKSILGLMMDKNCIYTEIRENNITYTLGPGLDEVASALAYNMGFRNMAGQSQYIDHLIIGKYGNYSYVVMAYITAIVVVKDYTRCWDISCDSHYYQYIRAHDIQIEGKRIVTSNIAISRLKVETVNRSF